MMLRNIRAILIGGLKNATSYRGASNCKGNLPICDAITVEPYKHTIELCKAGRFITENFYPDEPILKANEIIPTSTLTNYYMDLARYGILMYGIVEEGMCHEKLGIAIGHSINDYEYEDINDFAQAIRHKGTRSYTKLLALIEQKRNIQLLYNTKKNISIDVLAVHKDLRARQVGKMLLKAFIQSSLKHEYEIIRFATANEFAVRMALDAGFNVIYSVEPNALRAFTGETLMPNPLVSPHRDLKILVKDLRKVKRKPKQRKCGGETKKCVTCK